MGLDLDRQGENVTDWQPFWGPGLFSETVGVVMQQGIKEEPGI